MIDPVNASFRQRPPWFGGHLQTVHDRVARPRYDLSTVGEQSQLLVEVSDGDRLVVQLHRVQGDGPVVALVHGLGGSAESDYIRATTFGLVRAGFTVGRIDLRGAGLSGEHSRGMYHAGRTEDLRAALSALARFGPVAPVGFSLGGNLVLKLLGEPLPEVPVVAGATVSAPLDLALGTQHLGRVSFGAYEWYLMVKMRRDATRPTSAVTAQERATIARTKTILDFDNAITSRRHGWRDAAEYYAVNSSLGFLPKIGTPTLVIHSMDDPMIPSEPYRAVRWDELPAITRLITPHGGHVGFHAKGERLPWYVGRIAQFLRDTAA
ncbi:amino acid ABC transporter [Rhizocola hellebori]|uniref:Amino acid ABC transporter n=1 Tax=Rhizocola hellebori TaxID=1392758 RepID=A0A8J3QDI9_9ACTN|nr:alpha/beta fold hydrolase [Rhizocola hellebori]GIH07774.1 amino acid ABC transporter [Rhizocola hellebori]